MIRSFACKHTEKLFNGGRVPRFQSFMLQAERRLQILDSATCIEDLIIFPVTGLNLWGETGPVSIASV